MTSLLWQADTQHENWVGVLQEVVLPGTNGSPASFLDAAVAFCNDKCWGSLSASIFVPPDVHKSHPQAVEKAIADLQYGSIAVNAPSFVCFAFPYLAWGAFPGRLPQVPPATKKPSMTLWSSSYQVPVLAASLTIVYEVADRTRHSHRHRRGHQHLLLHLPCTCAAR